MNWQQKMWVKVFATLIQNMEIVHAVTVIIQVTKKQGEMTLVILCFLWCSNWI